MKGIWQLSRKLGETVGVQQLTGASGLALWEKLGGSGVWESPGFP